MRRMFFMRSRNQQHRVQICRVADAAALGEPFTLAALKRISPKRLLAAGDGAFGRTDPNDSVSVTGPGVDVRVAVVGGSPDRWSDRGKRAGMS